ncbi:MAG: response regulator [Phaeodactylibacter sp.]|nr:response regulator [Phaeodactylibacter sp.]
MRKVLYWLNYTNDINKDNIFSDSFPDFLKQRYTSKEVREMIEALEWSIERKGMDYKNLLRGLTFSNEEIFLYLTKLLKELKIIFPIYFSEESFKWEDIQSLSILVVEDQPIKYGFLKFHFDEEIHRVFSADNKNDGFEIYQNNKPDIILISLHNDLMDIFDLVKRIREDEDSRNQKTIPVIILIEEREKDSVEKIMALKNVSCLLLPVSIDDLFEEIYKQNSRHYS